MSDSFVSIEKELGPQGRVFYVAQNAVYVWTTEHRRAEAKVQSAVFRIPLDGAEPRALKTSGSPIDQFSFLESGDGHLNVLVRANARGEGMWSSESSAGDVALMRVRVDSFGNGKHAAPASSYTQLPGVQGHTVQNRFVGNYLLYGGGAGWGAPKAPGRNPLHITRWAQPDTVQTITLPHGVDRIEAKFTSAVVPEGRNTVVDLSEVSFIASMGLRMFIGLAKALKRNNAKIVLSAPQSQVNEVFNTVVMREIMPIVIDEAEAVRFAAT